MQVNSQNPYIKQNQKIQAKKSPAFGVNLQLGSKFEYPLARSWNYKAIQNRKLFDLSPEEQKIYGSDFFVPTGKNIKLLMQNIAEKLALHKESKEDTLLINRYHEGFGSDYTPNDYLLVYKTPEGRIYNAVQKSIRGFNCLMANIITDVTDLLPAQDPVKKIMNAVSEFEGGGQVTLTGRQIYHNNPADNAKFRSFIVK